MLKLCRLPLGPVALFVVTICPSALFAQASAAVEEIGSTTASATTNDAGPAGIIPYVKGFNLSLGTSSQHDSSNGWSSLISPDIAFRFNRHFSADASTPIYTYINVEHNAGTKARPVYSLINKRFIPGDTALNGHYETSLRPFDYNLTATLGLPTGSQNDGLGAGKVTYNFNNHMERNFGIFSPDIELGLGDSSQLITERIRDSYTAVGNLAHFQAGTSVDLTHNVNFEAEAYEELPLDRGTIYSTTGKGKKKVTTATTTGGTEDNGFLGTLDIPVSGHVTLSGFYNRSLRSRIDTGGFSLTFFLRAPPATSSAEGRPAQSVPYLLPGGRTPFIRRYSTIWP